MAKEIYRIYVITHTPTKFLYVGSTILAHTGDRWFGHIAESKARCPRRYFSRFLKHFGAAQFTIKTVERGLNEYGEQREDQTRWRREKVWIRKLNPLLNSTVTRPSTFLQVTRKIIDEQLLPTKPAPGSTYGPRRGRDESSNWEKMYQDVSRRYDRDLYKWKHCLWDSIGEVKRWAHLVRTANRELQDLYKTNRVAPLDNRTARAKEIKHALRESQKLLGY